MYIYCIVTTYFVYVLKLNICSVLFLTLTTTFIDGIKSITYNCER